MGEWTFFSNHGHVLLFLAGQPKARLRDVAEKVGITERAVQKIVHELQLAGYLEIRKQGRRNQYRINRRRHCRHPVESRLKIGQVINLLAVANTAASAEPASAPAPADRETGARNDAKTSARSRQQAQKRAEENRSDDISQQSLDF